MINISGRQLGRLAMLAAAAISFTAASALADGLPILKQKDKYKVGFAQTESNNPWRLAQTASMKAEAERLGWQLIYTGPAGSAAKQGADVNSMMAQGLAVTVLAPPQQKPFLPPFLPPTPA